MSSLQDYSKIVNTLCICARTSIFNIITGENSFILSEKTDFWFPKLVNIQMDYWYIIGILNIHWTVLTSVAWENSAVRSHLCNEACVCELLIISPGTWYKQWAASAHVTACLMAHVLRKGVMKLWSSARVTLCCVTIVSLYTSRDKNTL